jgi:hypothetical protein
VLSMNDTQYIEQAGLSLQQQIKRLAGATKEIRWRNVK